MARNSNKILFSGHVLERDSVNPFYQSYWAYADDLGSAIEKMIAFAKAEQGLLNPVMESCDIWEVDEITEVDFEVYPDVHAEVFWQTAHKYFPPEPLFALPIGVVGSDVDAENDVSDIEPGFTVSTHDDGLVHIQVNVDADDLFTRYCQILKLFSEFRVFWFVLHGHWDDHQDDGEQDMFLVNEGLNTPEKIISFLLKNRKSTIESGYVSFVSFLPAGSTNIKISDHKRIEISTYDNDVARQIIKLLEFNHYKQAEKLLSLDEEIGHWHYRSSDSLDREAFEQFLRDNGFVDWEPSSD